ncbi:MAG: PsbP-related protein [Patescibacteria group bacterium]
MNKKDNNKDQLIYIGLIIIFIIILTFRITAQSKKIGASIENIEKPNFEEESITKETEEEDQINFEQNFTSPDGNIEFKYPSDWQKVENEDVLKLFENPQQEDIENYTQQENFNEEEFEDFELEEKDLNSDKNKALGEVLFMGMKTTFPNLSFGVISVQKIDEEIEDSKELEKLMADKFKYNQENNKAEITNSEIGNDFVLMEVTTSTDDRAVFKSKNVGFLVNDNSYLINLNSPYEGWSDFENEFNMIISSVKLND